MHKCGHRNCITVKVVKDQALFLVKFKGQGLFFILTKFDCIVVAQSTDSMLVPAPFSTAHMARPLLLHLICTVKPVKH